MFDMKIEDDINALLNKPDNADAVLARYADPAQAKRLVTGLVDRLRAATAYQYEPQVGGKPTSVPKSLGGTGNPLNYTPGHPPVLLSKAKWIHIFRDGNKWCATRGDFVNLQESPAGFGDTEGQAIEALHVAEEAANAPL